MIDSITKNNLETQSINIAGYMLFDFCDKLSNLYENFEDTMIELAFEIVDEWKKSSNFNYCDWKLKDENSSSILSQFIIVDVNTYEIYMSKLERIFRSLSSPALLRLHVPYHEKNRVIELGAKYDTKVKSFYITEDQEFKKFEKWFPLTVELVPKTAWYKNLRDLLRPEDWDRIRKHTYKRWNYRCEVCGNKGDKHPVECHELWAYDENDYIQSLVRLSSLCPSCHMVKHIGLAGVRKTRGRALAHLARVNSWSIHATKKYVDYCFEVWSKRSNYNWTLKLDEFEKDYNIKINLDDYYVDNEC